jgi:hypothetical protein
MRQDSPGSVDARTAPGSAQIVQNNRDITPLAIIALLFGALGFLMGAIALRDSNHVADSAANAARAAAKAETATARANVAEIYAKQIYTELNRLGYPVKTPAEDHEPQPPEPVRNDP